MIISNSYYGGAEIIQLSNPVLYKLVYETINRQTVSLSIFYKFLQQKNINTDFKDFSSCFNSHELKSDYPIFFDIFAFMHNDIIIYDLSLETNNFWFDLITLGYFYSNNLFQACLLVFCNNKNDYIKQTIFDLFFSFINDPSIYIPKFPIQIIYEDFTGGVS